MKILLILFVLLFSFSVFADEINCSFKFGEVSYDNVSLETSLYKHLKFNLIFKTLSKLEWRVTDIIIPQNLLKNLHKAIDTEIEIFKKILDGKKLNKDEKYMLSFMAQYLDASIQEVKNEIKKLSRAEKKILLDNYKKNSKENLPMFDDFFLQLDIYVPEIISILNIPSDITTNKNMVYLTTVLDSGVMIKKEINYSKIMKNNSKNSMKLKIVLVDGLSFIFGSECNNKSKPVINNNDNIESKLKKLKSLFDQQLITQDEYDAKRKKILDAL